MSGPRVTGAIRPCVPADAASICDIYNHFVRETVVTFEEAAVAQGDMAQRIEAIVARFPWLVCALPNPASIALHEKLGFVKIAEFKEIGYKLGQWVDVGYWELLL